MTHSQFRTAPDGASLRMGAGTDLDPIAIVVRRRTEHMLRPQANGTVRLARPTELRPDQWDAVVLAQGARLKAYRDRVISDGVDTHRNSPRGGIR